MHEHNKDIGPVQNAELTFSEPINFPRLLELCKAMKPGDQLNCVVATGGWLFNRQMSRLKEKLEQFREAKSFAIEYAELPFKDRGTRHEFVVTCLEPVEKSDLG